MLLDFGSYEQSSRFPSAQVSVRRDDSSFKNLRFRGAQVAHGSVAQRHGLTLLSEVPALQLPHKVLLLLQVLFDLVDLALDAFDRPLSDLLSVLDHEELLDLKPCLIAK